MRRRTLLASLGTAATTATAGCFGALFRTGVSESFEDSYDVTDGTVLAVDNRNGDIRLRAAEE
jgi:hypothetical protein